VELEVEVLLLDRRNHNTALWYTNGSEAFTTTTNNHDGDDDHGGGGGHDEDGVEMAIRDSVERRLVLPHQDLYFYHTARLCCSSGSSSSGSSSSSGLEFYLDIRCSSRATRREFRSLIDSLKWVQ